MQNSGIANSNDLINKNYEKKLIALDYHPTAQKVAEIGFAVGKCMQAEITVIHLINDPTYYGSSVYDPIMGFGGYTNLNLLSLGIVTELKEGSFNFLEKTREHLGDATIKGLVREGSIAELILGIASELQTDVVVLGSHSRTWLENIIMGSITEYILHRSLVPLLIIPVRKVIE